MVDADHAVFMPPGAAGEGGTGSAVPTSAPACARAAAGETRAAKPCIVRVKRKRHADAPEDLMVERLAAPSKRPNTLVDALGQLGLAQGVPTRAAASSADQGTAQATDDGQPASRRHHFRKMGTLSARQLSALNEQQLQELLTQRRSTRAPRLGSGRGGVQHSEDVAAAAATVRAQQGLCAGQAARYEQILRRRGLSSFSQTEGGAPDPLQTLATVHDVVAHEQQHQAGGNEQHGGRQQRGQRQQQPYEEGTLLCNYLPMVREFLAEQQEGQVEDGVAAGAHGSGVLAGEGDGGAESDSEYVYDLYASAFASDDEEGGDREAWLELHTGGRAPVVRIIDEDTWLVVEASDAEDSCFDSEDSNAEGFFANDYPDEVSEYSSDEDVNPEGQVLHHSRMRGGWDNESFGSSGADDW